MSAFSLPMPPARLAPYLRRLTERSATIQMSEDSNQEPGTRRRLSVAFLPAPLPSRMQSGQHARDLLILIAPPEPRRLIDVTEIATVAQPDAFVRPSRSPSAETAGIPPATAAAWRSLPPGWRRSISSAPRLVGQGVLFDLRERQADPMKVEARSDTPAGRPRSSKDWIARSSLILVPGTWFPTSDIWIRSFGAWLEPRYIFGAGRLN